MHTPSLFVVDFLFLDLAACTLCKLAPRHKLAVQQVQRREPQLLQAPRLKLGDAVCADVTPALVAAPAVARGQAADGQALLGDVLPELALRLGREDDALLGDREDQAGVGVGFLLRGREGREAGFFGAFAYWVCLVIAAEGALGDGGRWFGGCYELLGAV